MQFSSEQLGRKRRSAGAVRPYSGLRFWLAALALLGSLSLSSTRQGAQQANPAKSPAPPQALSHIPFEMNSNHVLMQGRINDSGPLWFTLDTGAGISVINTRKARELGIQMSANGRARGAGGTAESSRLNKVTLSLPGAELKNLTLAATPLDSLEEVSGRSMDAIIGVELFQRYVVEVDYESKFITLYDPQQFVYKGAGESLPLTFFNNHPYIHGKILVSGLAPIEGDFVIDSGSGFGITVAPSFNRTQKLLEHIPKTIRTSARGVGGEFVTIIGRVEGLELGRFKLSQPVTAFPQTEGFISKEGSVGNIGGLILRHFKVIFDYPHKRMILEPNKNFAEPFDIDMSGLSLITDSPQFKLVKVHRVIEGSPAAEAGIKADDLILEVNGRAASELTLNTFREMLKKEGQQYNLKIKRGDETLRIQLKTRRLI